ncbi:MAG: ferritin family protein [Promethearchaeota archaeon]
MTQENLIKLLKKQLELEKESIRALRAEMKNIDHHGIKALFEICAADSTKHVNMIQIMFEYLHTGKPSKESFASTWQQRHRGIETIKEHIEREKDMIELLKHEVLATKDKMLKTLLKHILADEKRHHEILKKEIFNI